MPDAVHGGTAAPHPSAKDVFSITDAGTAGNFTLDVYLPTGKVTTAVIAWNASAATVLAAINTAAGKTVVESATGGVLATAPVVVTFLRSYSPVRMYLKTNSVTGGAGPVVTQTGFSPNRQNNSRLSGDHTQSTVTTARDRNREANTPQYGQTPYSPNPAGIASAVSTKDSANALGTTAAIHGHTPKTGKRTGFK